MSHLTVPRPLIVFALVTAVLSSCATAIAQLTLIPSAPPPVRGRHVTTFAEAASALDPARAEELATTQAQREYAAVLRLLRERRLTEADWQLVELVRSRDRDISATAFALIRGLLTDRTLPRLPKVRDRDEQAFLEALSHTRSAERWSSSTRPARQPLLPHTRDLVFLDVEINGTPTRLLLDTGANMTVISSGLAERLAVRALAGRAKAMGIGAGPIDAGLASIHLDIGAARVENHPVLVVDSSHLEQVSSGSGLPMLDGVVGWNAIQNLRLTMDRRARTLAIELSPRRPRGATGFFWIGRPLVTVQSENGLAMHFLLDTGAGRSTISPALAGEADLSGGRPVQVPLVGVGGRRMVEGSEYSDTVLYVGGARLVLTTLWAISPRVARTPYSPDDGVLGADALARGRIVIDFGSGEFSISPGSTPTP